MSPHVGFKLERCCPSKTTLEAPAVGCADLPRCMSHVLLHFYSVIAGEVAQMIDSLVLGWSNSQVSPELRFQRRPDHVVDFPAGSPDLEAGQSLRVILACGPLTYLVLSRPVLSRSANSVTAVSRSHTVIGAQRLVTGSSASGSNTSVRRWSVDSRTNSTLSSRPSSRQSPTEGHRVSR